MMISNREVRHHAEVFVWIWLPNETTPVVAGRLDADNGHLLFNYGRSYLERAGSLLPPVAIYEPELPLQAGALPLVSGLNMPGCIRDAAPDAWGRRVIINKVLGLKGIDVDTTDLNELTYLLESGTDRIGALDFQYSPTHYVPREANNVSLEDITESVERVERGIPLNYELDQVLFHASSIGGARPKALIHNHGTPYVAKFSTNTDLYNEVKAEFIAMRLAYLAGLNVAPVKLTKVLNKDVLLVERFDRQSKNNTWIRKAMVSALTILGLDEMMARYASYETLAEIIRHRFSKPKATLKELFTRLVFNVLSGNTDDHARNHAAFWNGYELALTPAYDICPQARTGNVASQAMLIVGNSNLSQLKTCLEAAKHFLLTENEARQIFNHLTTIIAQHWHTVCDEAELSAVEQRYFWKRQFLNSFSMTIE